MISWMGYPSAQCLGLTKKPSWGFMLSVKGFAHLTLNFSLLILDWVSLCFVAFLLSSIKVKKKKNIAHINC